MVATGETAARGERAAQLLNNQALLDALAALERDVVDAWEQCPARDAEGKEYFWQLYKNSKKFRAILAQYIEGGKLVKLREQKTTEKVAKFFRR